MVKAMKFQTLFGEIKYFLSNSIRESRGKFLLSVIISLMGIGVGVFFAIKTNSNNGFGALQEIDVSDFSNGFVASSSAFFSRTISLTLNAILLVVFSLSPVMTTFSLILFAYRGYLFGLNFALIFHFYGLGSMITAIVVILPCQLLMLFSLIVFFVLISNANQNCKKFGRADVNRVAIVFLGILFLTLENLVETLLLFLLSGKIILVI